MTNADLKIFKAKKSDMPHVLEMIHELAEYEKEPDAVDIDVAQLQKDGFEEKLFTVLLAQKNNQIAGMALYYPSYSTWKGRMIYLEDLYVKPAFRRKGIAGALLRALVKEADQWGAQRVKWQVLDWNETAINFYKQFNAQLDGEWINCDLYPEQIQNILDKQ